MHDSAALFPLYQVVCLLFVLLVPFASAGLALINTGLNRSHSAAHAILSSLIVGAIAVLIYGAIGFAFEGIPGQAGHSFAVSGKSWDWLGAGPFFLARFGSYEPFAALAVMFGMFTAALSGIIPAASLGERWRIAASCASTAVLAGWTYPLFAHWVWGGGWLAQLGGQFGLPRFVDVGGASCIHTVGGLTALALAWIIGPRRGRFTADGIPTAMPGHNAVVVLFGCLLAFVGFLGLNSAAAILFADRTPAQIVLVDINTTLGASSAALAALATTRIRFGRPDASLTANGWVTGLIAVSGGCSFFKPSEAVLIGVVAGALVIFAVELIELRMKLDDPTGGIAVHAGGGLWGILAAGIFGSNSGQFLSQLVGVATLIGLILPMTYALNWLLNRIVVQRVPAEGERQGTDLFELGAGAYPEFVTHREDWMRH